MPLFRVSKVTESGPVPIMETMADSAAEAVEIIKVSLEPMFLRIHGQFQDKFVVTLLPNEEDPDLGLFPGIEPVDPLLFDDEDLDEDSPPGVGDADEV